jgi:iron complex transport system substrate-binding protein
MNRGFLRHGSPAARIRFWPTDSVRFRTQDQMERWHVVVFGGVYEGKTTAPVRKRQRIVSLAPNVTSILFALGARRELVGVSKWCKDVAPVGRLPRVGDCWKLDIASVMHLKPTLLIGSVPFAPETVKALLDQPVDFLAINPRSLTDIESNIRVLARLVRRVSAGETLIAQMHRCFREVARAALGAKEKGKVRVYCEAWPKPRISSPPWVAELVELAGAKFVVPPGTRVTDDEIARANPEVIVLAWTAAGDRARPSRILQNPAWQNVSAVKNGRIVVIRDELLNTPGPPLMQGARELLRAIHGVSLRDPTAKRMLTVVAALIESDGKLLVCQRRRDASFGLLWEFPGGKVEPGESPEHALERELREELDIEVRVGSEVYRTTHKYAEMTQPIELIFFAARIIRGQLKNLNFEQVLWRAPESLTHLDFLPADRELIDRLAAGSLRLARP